MHLLLPSVQFSLRPGVIELKLGHPDLALLPVDGLLEATRVALERDGVGALSYGAEQGPGCLVEQLCARLGRLEGTAPPPEQLMITGGVSQALDMLYTILTEPGDVALVESPVYHLALRVLRDHRLDLVPVPSDEEGLRIDAMEEALQRLQRQGRRASLLYTVPTFNNPTGLSLAAGRREALIALAQRAELIILEDDVYHELWYDSPPPTSLYSLSPAGPVVHLGSFPS